MAFWTARAWLFNVSSGNEPKRPFWANSSPEAWKKLFGAQICHFGRPKAGYSISLVGMSRKGLFGPNRGRGAFWSSKLAFWTARAWLFNFSCGNEPKRPCWAKSWPGTFWNSNLPFWTARGRLLIFSCGNEPKRPFWVQILAGSLLELKFGLLTVRGRLLNFSSGNEPKRPFWVKSCPGAFWNSNLGLLGSLWLYSFPDHGPPWVFG